MKCLTNSAGVLGGVGFSLHTNRFGLVANPSNYNGDALLGVITSLVDPADKALLFRKRSIDALGPRVCHRRISCYTRAPALFNSAMCSGLVFP